MLNEGLGYIDETKLTLDEWLKRVYAQQSSIRRTVVDYQFPTDTLANEYVETIHTRSEQEIKKLLRSFLISTGSLGADKDRLDSWIREGKLEDYVERFEHARRLTRFNNTAWEGITWILDLLPDYPQTAIDAIDAYVIAHMQILPDGRWTGLSDAMMLIRARYFDLDHPREVLLGIRPRDFEYLVASVFEKMKYNVSVTQETRDGGYDIKATKDYPADFNTVLVECKLHDSNIGVKEIRALNGVVELERANKGILISASAFSKPAKQFARSTKRIELIDYEALNKLFNRYLGSDWPRYMDIQISAQKRQFETKQRNPTKGSSAPLGAESV